MKIGIFTDSYLPTVNGVTTSVVSTAHALQERGHDVTIVAPSFPKHKDQNKDIIRLRSVALPGYESLRVATYLPGASLIMATRLDLDIIHGHNGGPVSWLGWEVSTVKRIPYVFTYHTLFNQYTHYFLRGKVIRPGMMDVATRVFGNMTDRVIAPTAKIEKELLRYGVKRPITVLPSGIDLSLFRPTKGGYLRSQLKIGADEIIFLYAGRLGKEKSIDLVVRSFAKTLTQQPNCHLVIAGDGPDRHKLEQLAGQVAPGKVHFLGFVDRVELPGVYSSADAFVFASKTETQGLVVPEAMACGLPVVVVRDPVYDGLVKNGYQGLVVPSTVASFSRAMTQLAKFPEERVKMGQSALLAAQALSLDTVTDRLIDLYAECIRQSPPSDFVSIPPWLKRDLRDLLSDRQSF